MATVNLLILPFIHAAIMILIAAAIVYAIIDAAIDYRRAKKFNEQNNRNFDCGFVYDHCFDENEIIGTTADISTIEVIDPEFIMPVTIEPNLQEGFVDTLLTDDFKEKSTTSDYGDSVTTG